MKNFEQKQLNLVELSDYELIKFDGGFILYYAAAATVLARMANGWKEWKYKSGLTLDEVKRQGKPGEQ